MGIAFGIFDHMERRQSVGLDQLYSERLELLALADRLGFWGYHLAEHHQAPLGVAPSQNVFLAAAAQRTERIQLCPLVYCLPFYHPLRLIDEIAMLDNLSGGRLQVGVGRGISGLEHRFWGNDPDQAARRFAEEFDILVQGLTNERLTHHGVFHDFDDIPMILSPKQKPYPPFWYPGNLEYAARRGMNHLGGGPLRSLPAQAARYRNLWEQHRDDPDRLNPHVSEPKLGAVKVVFVADSDAEAEAVARRAFKVRAANWPKPGYDEDGLTGAARPGFIHPSFGGDFDLATKVEALLTGSPDTVRAQVRAFAEGSGMNYFVGAFQWGDLSHAEAAHSLELFATKVMPGL
jgi:alkanesulfonate monooxygenase SsuD/methylene tetrahydromethanopterin reductase-like flavin-dependent oxidoreductase (luciferase family)